jgi:hypothetical protein
MIPRLPEGRSPARVMVFYQPTPTSPQRGRVPLSSLGTPEKSDARSIQCFFLYRSLCRVGLIGSTRWEVAA